MAAGLSAASSVQAAPAQGDARIAIVTPLSLIKLYDLDFGRVIPGASGGTVDMGPDGVRTSTGSIILVGTNFRPAQFAGKGTFNQRIQISISNSIILTGPGPQMRVDNFDFGPDPSLNRSGNSHNARITTSSGIFTFPVGARLTVGANQTAGVYTGTFAVTADYQ